MEDDQSRSRSPSPVTPRTRRRGLQAEAQQLRRQTPTEDQRLADNERRRQVRIRQTEEDRAEERAANADRRRQVRIAQPQANAFRVAANGPLDFVVPHTLGSMTLSCPSCGALHWKQEKVGGSLARPIFSLCCAKGTVTLPNLLPPPEPLATLLAGDDALARRFRRDIRQYNSALQLASSAARADTAIATGVHQFRISGNVHHLMGLLHPGPGERPQFAQLYILDGQAELDGRRGIMPHIQADILQQLQEMLHLHNPFVRSLCAAAAIDAPNVPNVRIIFRADGGPDRRRYNEPTTPEVAAFVPDGVNTEIGTRDIVVYLRGGGVRRLNELNPAYDPLHFVLLFPRGELGLGLGIRLAQAQHVRPVDEVHNSGNDGPDDNDVAPGIVYTSPTPRSSAPAFL